MRIIAFAGDVELTTNVSFPAFGALLRSTSQEHVLQPADYAALLQLFGVQRNAAPVSPTRDDLSRVAQLLASTGMVVEQDAQPAAMAHEHRVALLDGVHLLPAIYEVRDARKPLRYCGVFEAAIVDACDGHRSVAQLDAVVRSHGYEVQLADITAELEHLRAAGLIQPQNGSFRKRPDLVLRPDVLVVRTLWSDLSHLMSGDEVDVLMRCREARTAGEIVRELAPASRGQESWILQVLARASTLKLLAHAAPRPSQLLAMGEIVDEDRTVLGSMEEALTTGDAMTVVSMEDHRTAVNPAADATPSGAGQMFARMLPPSRPSWPTAADSGVQVANGPPPVAPSQPLIAVGRDSRDMEARLASLSLPKDGSAIQPQPRTGSSGGSKLPWILLAVVVVAFGVYHFTRGGDPPEVASAPPPPPPGGGSQSLPTTSGRTLIASGFIAAKTPIVLSATPGSKIDEIAVASGDKITKGQIVAKLADGQLRAELKLANAKYSGAASKKNQMEALVKAQAATRVQLEALKGDVEVARAEVGIIKQRLEDTKIKSPIDGTVLEVLAHPGEVLTPGATQVAGVMRIADLTILVAEVNVNENDLKYVYLGQHAELITDVQREQKYKGTVAEIAEQADRAKGTIQVKVNIEPTTDTVLKPGMTIQVRFAPKPPAGP